MVHTKKEKCTLPCEIKLGIIVGGLIANNRLSTVVICKTNVPM